MEVRAIRIFLNAVLLGELPSGANRHMVGIFERLPRHLPEAELYVGIQRRLAGRFSFPGVTTVPLRTSGSYGTLGTLARALLLRREVARCCDRLGIDLCHLFALPPFRVPGARMLLTIHDNRYLVLPGQYGRLRYLANRLLAGRVASMDAIVTVSECMRAEIRRLYGVEQVYVVPNGVGPCGRSWQPVKDRPYFATVSRREPRKDLGTLLRAVEAAEGRLRLVVIGCEGQSTEDVQFVGLVGDDERERLTAGATGFVFPSRYEGFGIPPLEAQAMGVPVISARASALPEVLGDAALYFPPGDGDALCRKMLELAEDAALQRRLSARGRANASRYTWDAAARALADVYREVHLK